MDDLFAVGMHKAEIKSWFHSVRPEKLLARCVQMMQRWNPPTSAGNQTLITVCHQAGSSLEFRSCGRMHSSSQGCVLAAQPVKHSPTFTLRR